MSKMPGARQHTSNTRRNANSHWQSLALLLMGATSLAHSQKYQGQRKYVIVAVDHFSKWAEVEATQSITTQQTISLVRKNIFTRFGIPKTIITDNGT